MLDLYKDSGPYLDSHRVSGVQELGLFEPVHLALQAWKEEQQVSAGNLIGKIFLAMFH